MKSRMARSHRTLRPARRLHRVPALLPQQNPARRHSGRQRFSRTRPHPPRNRKHSAARSRNPSAAILRRLAEGGTVQDELVTIRGERFVIPVKVEQKRRVQGVVHGASSSGQTVFVEPLETIEQNNELVRLLEEELAEIHRILARNDAAHRRPRRTNSSRSRSPRANSNSNSPKPASPKTTTAWP